MSFPLWLLALIGALFWVVAPAGVLVMAVVYRGHERPDPEAVQPCRGYDPTNPAAKPCWVPAGMEYCPRHDGSGEDTFIP